MNLFRRTLRWLFMLAGFGAGVITAVALFFSRYLVKPRRQPLWATPADLGLPFEEVHFPAADGLRLAGWFIPGAARNRATVLLVHGLHWNRLGNTASDMLAGLDGATPVDLMRLAYALHQDGFNVFTFDLRNHGQSAAMPPVTMGLHEARDVMGALTYLESRADVSPEHVGAIGFSIGANALLYALPQTDGLKAAILVQPTSADVFADGYLSYMFGAVARLIRPLAEWFYQLQGGMEFAALRPISAVSGSGDTPLLFIQGDGDQWGSLPDVQAMASAAAQVSIPLVVDTLHRSDGYRYLLDNPKIAAAFFEQNLPE